jgi:hypothetical protein
MHYDQAIDMRPTAEVQSPSGLGNYRPNLIIGWKDSVRAPDTNTRYFLLVSHGSFGNIAPLQLKAGMEAWKMTDANYQWRRQVFDPMAPNHVDALTETVEATLDYIAEFGPQTLDLQGVQNNFVHAEHLAAVLRASSTWSDQVPGWNDALRAAVAAVKSSGQDPKDVLFGMV